MPQQALTGARECNDPQIRARILRHDLSGWAWLEERDRQSSGACRTPREQRADARADRSATYDDDIKHGVVADRAQGAGSGRRSPH